MTDYPDIRLRKIVGKDIKSDWFETTEECQVAGSPVIIPQYFITDFASIPRVFWVIFSPYGKATQASVLHDYMYSSTTLSGWFGSNASRYVADRMFYNNMLASGVPKVQAYLMYKCVRIFGGSRYGNNKREVNVVKK